MMTAAILWKMASRQVYASCRLRNDLPLIWGAREVWPVPPQGYPLRQWADLAP